jgi:hypothetical protein
MRSLPVTAAIGVDEDSSGTVAIPLPANNAVAAATEPDESGPPTGAVADVTCALEACTAAADALDDSAAEGMAGGFGASVTA